MWRMIHKDTGKQIRVNDTCKGFYQTRAAVVRAVKTSGVLRDLGLTWQQIDLVDHWGRTMAERSFLHVADGFCLRHREGWYYRHPTSQKAWYKTAAALETAFLMGERWLSRYEERPMFADPWQAGFDLYRGAPGTGKELVKCYRW